MIIRSRPIISRLALFVFSKQDHTDERIGRGWVASMAIHQSILQLVNEDMLRFNVANADSTT